jgi:hypothetical protein
MKALKFYWDNTWLLLAFTFITIVVGVLVLGLCQATVIWIDLMVIINVIRFVGLMIQFKRRKV